MMVLKEQSFPFSILADVSPEGFNTNSPGFTRGFKIITKVLQIDTRGKR